MSRWGLRRSIACVLIGLGAVAGCSGTIEGTPTTTPDPAAPAAIEFAVAASPSMTTDLETFGDVRFMTSTVVDDHLVVGGSSGGVTVFDMDDNDPVWSLEGFGDQVAEGRTRALPLQTSSAAGGVVLVGYTEECRSESTACADAPEGTRTILGIAAVGAADGKVVWRAALATSGPDGSDTASDDIYLEPGVVDADAEGVLATVSTHDGEPTPAGTPGMTTMLLDAETGEEQWRVVDFRGGFLTADAVLGVQDDQVTPGEPHPDVVTSAVNRTTGKATDGTTMPETWVESAGGPGVVVDDRSEDGMETRNIHVLGPDGRPVATDVDQQRLAQATCPEPDVETLLACAVMGRGTDSMLVSWADGEAAPTVAPAPLPGHQQVWAVSGDLLVISENGYQNNPTTDPAPTWFVAKRDGTVISARYPGTAVAASENHVVTRTISEGGRFVLNTWRITQRP